MKPKHVAIIGSHGLYANYGGWDQLVNNLVELGSSIIHYTIYNSKESQTRDFYPKGVNVIHLPWKASGIEGMVYDLYSLIQSFWKADVLLLLGVQSIPLVFVLQFFRKVRVIGNVGGIEWERPKFNIAAKIYLKFCFFISTQIADVVILDNKYYGQFLPKNYRSDIKYIPYGGFIDSSRNLDKEILNKYPFIAKDYFLSISRAIADNQVEELCNFFAYRKETLVMISNFSSSDYGKHILEKHGDVPNIILINGLYIKDELDLIRRKCKAYIHTHTLCGTAPSLVEMIMARRPIISIDAPQNRFTLNNSGVYFNSFSELGEIIEENKNLEAYISDSSLLARYNWQEVVDQYETIYFSHNFIPGNQ